MSESISDAASLADLEVGELMASLSRTTPADRLMAL